MCRENVERVHVEPKDGQVAILHGNIEVYQYRGFDYKLDSIQSVIDLVKVKGSKERTVLFYNDSCVQVILDDTVTDRPKDEATYSFKFSDSFSDWRKILGSALTQKGFVDFLKRRPYEETTVLEPLLAKVQNLKLMTEIVGEYTYDDNNNISFMYKTKDGEKMTKLPSVITINLAILNESDFFQSIEFELELKKPKSENEKPVFILTCPKMDQYIKNAVAHEVGILKSALDGYFILAGSK